MNKTIITQTNKNIPRPRGARWLVVASLLIVLLLALLTMGSTSEPAQPWVMVHFEDGTTLEQAAQSLEGYSDRFIDKGNYIYRHITPLGADHGSGGIQYKIGGDLAGIYGQLWRRFYTYQLGLIERYPEYLKDPSLAAGHANMRKNLADAIAEKENYDNTIFGCWDNGTCPPVTVAKIQLQLADRPAIEELANLPSVNSVIEEEVPSLFFMIPLRLSSLLWDFLFQTLATSPHQG